ncbi:tripartite tricarboxylate transporter TctB family protein [Sagittula salina]|uniref:Tripartite tricarboxylate transporter TctB family protein n=1 Tax=Sagittula salina TaxID=2820268 RepID=A0A940MU62_9RHOB|nr:tripartite tricarboxylate transporter TctB family protein [Sagittula salina]MBP0484936.1 tripartite tricarboxylate transporter TctB family protein [Sagittula salina]
MSDDNPSGRKQVGSDLVIPVVGMAYAVYYVYSVWEFPPEAQRSGFFLAGMLVVLGLIFFARIAVLALRGQVELEFHALLGPPEGRLRRLGFVGLIGAYLLTVQTLGFTLTTFAFLFLGSLVAGLESIRRAATFAAVAALSGWLFFIVLLGTRFPIGPFETLMNQVMPWR